MSDYVTYQELGELMQGLLSGIDERLERMENQILTRIENGVGKQVQAQGELLQAQGELLRSVSEKQGVMERHVARLTEDVQAIKDTLSRHDDEIITLRRIK